MPVAPIRPSVGSAIRLLTWAVLIAAWPQLASANSFELSSDEQGIRLSSRALKPLYHVNLELHSPASGQQRHAGPAYMAPAQQWVLNTALPPAPELLFAVSFCDEGGIPGQVFATRGYLPLPPLTLPAADGPQSLDALPLGGLHARHLYWRDQRDLPRNDPLAQCTRQPPLRHLMLPDGRAPGPLDAQPVSGSLQLLGKDEQARPVAQTLQVASPPLASPMPLWVRQPLLPFVAGMAAALAALRLALRGERSPRG